MDKAEFLTIFPTFEKLETVQKTLPSVLEETLRQGARLIVHDSSESGREEKWTFLRQLNKNNVFILILSSNISMAHARNMCLGLGQELFAPDFICMLEDDHGYRPGLIPALVSAMRRTYGRRAPNNLRYGLYTACLKHTRAKLQDAEQGGRFPRSDNTPMDLGGFNSCFRCAPSSHWSHVLKGYDTDEYLISNYQTGQLRMRNYHKGFTTLFVGGGELTFSIEGPGRGEDAPSELKLWDREFCASDPRSRYLGKNQGRVAAVADSVREIDMGTEKTGMGQRLRTIWRRRRQGGG